MNLTIVYYFHTKSTNITMCNGRFTSKELYHAPKREHKHIACIYVRMSVWEWGSG